MSRDLQRSNTRAWQTIVLEDTEISGVLHVNGDLLLMGRVNGDIKCSGHVVINEEARVTGNVSCDLLELGGTVEGKVKSTVLTLREEGVVKGEVETCKLRVCGEKIHLSTLRLEQNKEF
jgi:cytoskeletal protein CcmA (bactofilin family)